MSRHPIRTNIIGVFSLAGGPHGQRFLCIDPDPDRARRVLNIDRQGGFADIGIGGVFNLYPFMLLKAGASPHQTG